MGQGAEMQKLALSHFPLAQHQQASEASVGQFSLCPTLGSLVSVPSCAPAGAAAPRPSLGALLGVAWMPGLHCCTGGGYAKEWVSMCYPEETLLSFNYNNLGQEMSRLSF